MAVFSGIGRAGDGVRTPDKDIMGGRGLLNHCFNLKISKKSHKSLACVAELRYKYNNYF